MDNQRKIAISKEIEHVKDLEERCERLTALRTLYDPILGLYDIVKSPKHLIQIVEKILPGTAEDVNVLMQHSSPDTNKTDVINNIVNRWVNENRHQCEIYENIMRINFGRTEQSHVKYLPILQELRKMDPVKYLKLRGGARRRLGTRRKTTAKKSTRVMSLLRKRRSVKKVGKKTKKYMKRIKRV